MKMKLGIIILSLSLFRAFSDSSGDQDFFESLLTLSLSPGLGGYEYVVDTVGGSIYTGGLNVLSLEYEARFFSGSTMNHPYPSPGVYAYAEATGHLYEGHEESNSAFNRIWGLPNGKIGIGLRLSREFGNFELSAGGAAYYVVYMQAPDERWPGTGLSGNIRLLYRFTDSLSGGVNAFYSKSRHRGGPEPNDPGVTRLLFIIREYGGGLNLSYRF